jgi:glycosyltransferase involved in cell wall biosynthesis
MRIGIDATPLPERIAGAGRYVCKLIGHLSKIDSDNEYLVFVKQRDAYLFPTLPANFSLVELPNFPRSARILWQLTRPSNYARKLGLDVWHAPHYISPFGLNETSLVVTIHDLTFFLFPHLYPISRRHSFQNFIRSAVKRADTLITVSNNTRNDLLQLFPEAEPRTRAIYSGVDIPVEVNGGKTGSLGTRRRYCNGAPYVLSVGTLERRKNIPFLISSYSALVRKEGISHHLILAGQPGNDIDEIRKTIVQENMADRVHLTGYVNETELQDLYRAADLFVCPSIYEGFGFPVLEAMATGIPTLCSNAGATAEITANQEMHFPVDDENALSEKMKRALTERSLRHRLINYGQSRAVQFSWEKTVQETRAAYEDLASVAKSHKGPYYFLDLPHQLAESIGSPPAGIREAILRALIFSDLFEYPMSLEEIHRGLAGLSVSAETLHEVISREPSNREIQFRDGYYFLAGRDELVALRMNKKQKTRELLERNRRELGLICSFPFVQAVALSGTTAFENVNGNDDIDLFILVEGCRTWTTYLLLALCMKVLRKRTTMCFNYLEGHVNQSVPQRNFFVAHQIVHLKPISGNGAFERYWRANKWILKYFPQAKPKQHLQSIPLNSKDSKLSRLIERLLSRPVFNRLENLIYRSYARRIHRLTSNNSNSKVRIDPRRIQLFTNDHQGGIMKVYHERLKNIPTNSEAGV